MYNILPIPMNRTKQKLASWRCYRSGHSYTYSQLQEAAIAIWQDEDATIKCQRCGKVVDVDECDAPELSIARVNKTLFGQ